MTREVVFAPRARDDLFAIWDYLIVRNRAAAMRFMNRFQAAFMKLAEMPGIGHRRSDVTDDRYRFWTVKPYVIAYRFDATTLTVVRILHGSRDFRAAFVAGF